MTLRAQAKFDAGDVREKAEHLLRRLRAIKRDTTANPGKLRELIDEYTTMVERLGLPDFTGDQLDPRETATFQRLQRLFDEIERDIRSLFASHRGLASMMVRSYNRSQAILLGSQAEMRNAAAESLQAAIQGGLTQRGTFVAVESFDDLTRVDEDKTNADIATSGGALTLRKTDVFPVDQAASDVVIEADGSIPAKRDVPQAAILAGQNKTEGNNPPEIEEPRFRVPYEGNFFDLLGQAEFEAGRLKLIDDGSGGLKPAETEEFELTQARRVLVDGSVDTYHQIERVVLGQEETLDPARLDSLFPYDFKVRYTLDASRLVSATALVLDPMNFGGRAWLEIVTIETSVDGDIWEEIPGLHNHTQFSTLTNEANKVLNTNQANTIMAPSKYRYGGKGLWIFGAREFRYLRFTVLQKTPIPNPYEIVEVKQKRQVTKSKKAAKIGPFKFGKDKKKTKTETRWIELSYEEGLKMFNGDEVLDQDLGSYRAEKGIEIDLPGIGNIFSGGGTSIEKSAWQTSDVRTKVKENAVRYAVGIREIELLTANYAQTSVYQSKPFRVAAPVRQIHLMVDDQLPELGENSSIKYSVSVDGGNTWTRIAPNNQPPQYEAGARIPTIVQVNSSTPDDAKDNNFGYLETDNPSNEVRVRIELSRPADNQGTTPVIKRYALEILTSETKGLDI